MLKKNNFVTSKFIKNDFIDFQNNFTWQMENERNKIYLVETIKLSFS